MRTPRSRYARDRVPEKWDQSKRLKPAIFPMHDAIYISGMQNGISDDAAKTDAICIKFTILPFCIFIVQVGGSQNQILLSVYLSVCVCDCLFGCLSSCLGVCLSVFAFVCLSRSCAYISVLMKRISIKLGRCVGSLVQWMVIKFGGSNLSDDVIIKYCLFFILYISL